VKDKGIEIEWDKDKGRETDIEKDQKTNKDKDQKTGIDNDKEVVNVHVRYKNLHQVEIYNVIKVVDVPVHHNVVASVNNNKDNDFDLIHHQKVTKVILVMIHKRCRN